MFTGEKKSKRSIPKIKPDHLLPILVCALAIPLSMSMWLFNIGYTYFTDVKGNDDLPAIHPTRWLFASFVSLVVIVYGLKKKSLSLSGAFLGFFVGMILTLGNYAFLACLFTFFITSSKATKYRGEEKSKLEEDYKEGGQRSWIHVLCNGGMATQLGLLYLLDVGCGERAVNFALDYRPSWLSMGILGSFASCNGDTWASELGTVLSRGDPFLITTRKQVPKGTNGGVSVAGLLLSAIGGVVVGAANYITIILCANKSLLSEAPPQWPLLLVGGLGGFLGSLLDSLLGATLQYSGIDNEGHIVSSPGKGVTHISGRRLLDNHGVNLICSVVMGIVMPYVAKAIWPQ